MRGLRDRGVLITGGTSGIGHATARRFLDEGARVFVCGLEGVQETLDEFDGVGGVHCDVSDEASVERMLAAAGEFLGGVDILINNAGIAHREPFLDIATDRWDTVLAVNLRGMFLVAQRVAASMRSAGTRGAIVNMASTNALGGEAGYAHYNASKAGVLLLTKTMAVELGPHGIRVNALCPGYIRTPLNAAIEAESGDPDYVAAYEREHIPLGRAGHPDEVAAAYAFLASEDASFINGAELVIDGGQLAIM
ncbi:3-oxoacyl-[acyl-carrier protein] reductase [Actinomadura pelletieri DSM 43383]|uniref:3-oxoacyl-[acyl-carrier protein] reductase n=1 Tax=Actinomadura pelletieri DSM 43383 TaxID=1120940 RepID=A0A495QTD4_9ACTN|nr:SDR family NAD(P)-dependent oxidoreductase [Actinomadura pelletieri]RKS76713.1 3-oxoacyl-[acyl-carrier protein] reductase [Actinomadura pelletieri DSM 43383]